MAGGQGLFAARIAQGIYGDSDSGAWKDVTSERSRRDVWAMATLAACEAAPITALLLLLPEVARVEGISATAVGTAIVLSALVAIFSIFPAIQYGAGWNRTRVAVVTGINLAIIGILLGQTLSPPLLWLVLGLRAFLAACAWATNRPLVEDLVPPEARVRALTRYRIGTLLGASAGAAAAGLALVGPQLGAAKAISGVSIVAALVSLLALRVREPGLGGAEAARIEVVFGPQAAVDGRLSGMSWDSLGRVAGTPAARTTLAGYVGAGFAFLGMLIPAQQIIRDRGVDNGVSLGVAALGISAALAVVTIPLIQVGWNVERMRRKDPNYGAKPAFGGMMVALTGVVSLALNPASAGLPSAYALCAIGGMITVVALDGVLLSVVPVGDRTAAAALSSLSTVAGGILGYLVVTFAGTSSLPVGFFAAALPIVAVAFAVRRSAHNATQGVDDVYRQIVESTAHAMPPAPPAPMAPPAVDGLPQAMWTTVGAAGLMVGPAAAFGGPSMPPPTVPPPPPTVPPPLPPPPVVAPQIVNGAPVIPPPPTNSGPVMPPPPTLPPGLPPPPVFPPSGAVGVPPMPPPPVSPLPVPLAAGVRPSRRPGTPVLECSDVNFFYGSVEVLYGVSLYVAPGELVALLGPNGVGKTTTLRTLSGLGKPRSGVVRIDGVDVTSQSAPSRVALGLSQIVGGEAVFGSMTVAENLRVFGYSLGTKSKDVDKGIDQAFSSFPKLSDRRNQLASTLSGGEKQMLGLAKAVIIRPKVLLIDEFSLGLAPVVVGDLLKIVRQLNADGVAVLVVEQSVNVALSLVDRAYFMERGRITYEGSAEALKADPDLVTALSLGGAHAQDTSGVSA